MTWNVTKTRLKQQQLLQHHKHAHVHNCHNASDTVLIIKQMPINSTHSVLLRHSRCIYRIISQSDKIHVINKMGTRPIHRSRWWLLKPDCKNIYFMTKNANLQLIQYKILHWIPLTGQKCLKWDSYHKSVLVAHKIVQIAMFAPPGTAHPFSLLERNHWVITIPLPGLPHPTRDCTRRHINNHLEQKQTIGYSLWLYRQENTIHMTHCKISTHRLHFYGKSIHYHQKHGSRTPVHLVISQ